LINCKQSNIVLVILHFRHQVPAAMPIPPKDKKHPDPVAPTLHKPLDRHALYAADQHSRDTSAVFHVLDALEPPPGKQRMLRGGLILLAGACLIVAIGLLLGRYTDDIRVRPEALSRQAADRIASDELPEAIEGTEKQQLIPDAFAAMAASHLSPEAAGPDARRAPIIEQPLAANAVQPPDVRREAGERPSSPAARKPQHEAQKQATRKTALKGTNTRAAAGSRERNSKAGRQPEQSAKRMLAKGKTIVPDKSKRNDADVDLIAALLSRVQNKTSKPGNVSAVEKPAQAITATEARSPELHASLGSRTANSDVVIRTQADTTESLVKRCGALGFIEGQFCRARICSGLWGKDAACPLSSPANLH
jgi:hypothetical protein